MKFKIRFINIALSFLLFCVGFLSVSTRVYAYTSAENFYPLNYQSMHFTFFDLQGNTINSYQAQIDSDNKYNLNNIRIDNIYTLNIFAGADSTNFTFPYNSTVYDYYFLGSSTAKSNNDNESTWKPSYIYVAGYNPNTGDYIHYPSYDINIYNVDTDRSKGFGFSFKIGFDEVDNIGINNIYMSRDKDGTGSKPANLSFQFGVLAVEKGQSETAVLSQILNQLQNMENSINGTIDSAADQVTGSIDSASNSINSKLEESFDFLTSNLTDWFDDVFNGYGGSGTDQASDNFDTSAGELHTTETQLTDITNSSVTNYTDFAFNTNVLTTLGASLVYVVTWFTNFWDLGGLFTAVLNIGLALFVAFFILRLRGDP